MGLHAWLRWAGLGLGIGGVLLLGWADRCLGENLSITLQIKDGHTLVTTGPYSRVRHPIYTAAIIVTMAMFVVSSNWIVGACFVGPMAVLCAERIPREEEMLIGRFGDEYRAYIKRTGRLLPRIIRKHSSNPSATS